ncbi:MAG: hypothetical protein Q4C54_04950 [Clostridia bacterium]|nr:hypothetical protein [Clostridia bacterium]
MRIKWCATKWLTLLLMLVLVFAVSAALAEERPGYFVVTPEDAGYMSSRAKNAAPDDTPSVFALPRTTGPESTYTDSYGTWTYCISDALGEDAAAIVKYEGTATNLVIPATLGGYPTEQIRV